MNTSKYIFHVKSDEGENLTEGLMPPPILIEAEIEASCQRRECVGRFVQTYWESTGHGPSDGKIVHYLECEGRHDTISWVNPDNHHRVYVLVCKGICLIDPANASRYHWMNAKIVRTPFILNIVESVTQANIITGNTPDWEIFTNRFE